LVTQVFAFPPVRWTGEQPAARNKTKSAGEKPRRLRLFDIGILKQLRSKVKKKMKDLLRKGNPPKKIPDRAGRNWKKRQNPRRKILPRGFFQKPATQTRHCVLYYIAYRALAKKPLCFGEKTAAAVCCAPGAPSKKACGTSPVRVV
jgi:hypothetical protein